MLQILPKGQNMRRVLGSFLIAIAIMFGGSSTSSHAKQVSVPKMEYYKFGKMDRSKHPAPSPALPLVGGGDHNFDALRWFFGKAGGGDIVVLSASYGREIGVEFYEDVGGIQSVQIFVLHDRSQSTNRKLLRALAKADGIFIAGGDQSRYIRYWRGTPVHQALLAHVDAGKPLGGTSGASLCWVNIFMARWMAAA